MSAAAFAFLVTGVMLNAAAQLLLKAGTNRLGIVTFAPGDFTATLSRIAVEVHVLAGLALYAISVVVWIAGLSRVPVSVAYPKELVAAMGPAQRRGDSQGDRADAPAAPSPEVAGA